MYDWILCPPCARCVGELRPLYEEARRQLLAAQAADPRIEYSMAPVFDLAALAECCRNRFTGQVTFEDAVEAAKIRRT